MPQTVQTVVNRALTSGVPHINLGILKSLLVTVPAVPYQRRVVEVLSEYDALIDINRRRMALLEDAARQLYNEWFVRLRFPGHEHVRVINDVPDASTIDPYLGHGRKCYKTPDLPEGKRQCQVRNGFD